MPKNADVYILGVHDGHAAGAVLLKNGEVLAAINEERLTQIKNHACAPKFSIQKVLEIAGVSPAQITLIAVASFIRIVTDPQTRRKLPLFMINEILAPYLHGESYIRASVALLKRIRPRTELFDTLKTLGLAHIPPTFIEHHQAHAASAFYPRPWRDETLIFTLDGMGDGISSTVSIGKGDTIKRIAFSSFYDSVSDNIYSEITEYLGMKRLEHEYKLMGLAPYGDYTKTMDVFRKIIRLNPKNPLTFENISRCYSTKLQPLYQKILFQKRFDHIAAGTQFLFEELVISWVKNAIKQTGITKIAAGGGSFLNVKANMHLRALAEIDDMFIYPAADDGGLAYGAAIEAYIQYCKKNNITSAIPAIGPIYYGQEFTNDAIVETLKKKKLIRKAQKTDPQHIASLIAAGKIVAHFAGRDEWGPRALGNRSIIADPRNLAVVARLNQVIKQRDFWMPFAPAILENDQEKYIVSPRFSPFMTETFATTVRAQREIVATIHPADKTARVMTVNKWNTKFYEIIKSFKKKTKVGAVLNTSFNLHGFPLVSTPEQALWTFQNSGLDALVLEDWIISKA